MKNKIYLDTSVISALFDERTPERLSMTSALWLKLNDYEVAVSEKNIIPVEIISPPEL